MNYNIKIDVEKSCQNVAECIEKSELRSKDIAEALNVTAAAVSNWKRESKLPNMENLLLLSMLLNVDLKDMLVVELEREDDDILDGGADTDKKETSVPETSGEKTTVIGDCLVAGEQNLKLAEWIKADLDKDEAEFLTDLMFGDDEAVEAREKELDEMIVRLDEVLERRNARMKDNN